MNRREALSRTALLLGTTIIGAEAFITGCAPKNAETAVSLLDFSPHNLAFLDEIAETIIPATPGVGGAKAAGVSTFMQVIVTDCYEPADQEVFMSGLGKIQSASMNKYDEGFMDLSPERRLELLNEIDKEAKAYVANRKEGQPNHYFTLMKQLTLLAYFTSEVGSTQALRYLPVPGKYEGCIPYQAGDKQWAAI